MVGIAHERNPSGPPSMTCFAFNRSYQNQYDSPRWSAAVAARKTARRRNDPAITGNTHNDVTAMWTSAWNGLCQKLLAKKPDHPSARRSSHFR